MTNYYSHSYCSIISGIDFDWQGYHRQHAEAAGEKQKVITKAPTLLNHKIQIQPGMKIISSILLVALISISGYSQEKYFTKNGKITFYSRAPLEDIEAKNNNAVSVFDKSTGQVELSILMKSFQFEKALMEEHFNENYVESDKFPKSVFKGIINDLSKVDFNKNGKYNTTVAGKLTMHGETKDIIAPVTFTISNEVIRVDSEFNLILADFKVSIPSLVSDKVGKEVKIIVGINYELLRH